MNQSPAINSKESLGVSVVICCHNSATRLPQTLAYLARQQAADGHIPWEVIVIDNGSTDQTATLATEQWPTAAPAPLRVVNEPQLGLIYARLRGFSEAKFELVCFIDDDNWVYPHWIETVSDLMGQYPDVGACGGWNVAVSEQALPSWFARHCGQYAVGEQGSESGYIAMERGYLYGAGLTIRKLAWQQLLDGGFRPSLLGRQGKVLSAGEDSELCYALRLAGWRLWYEKRLKLEHFLPAHRLEWPYMRQIHHGTGAAFVVLGIYLQALQPSTDLLSRLKQIWLAQVIASMGSFVWHYGQWRFSQLFFSKWRMESEQTESEQTESEQMEDALLRSEYYKGKLSILLWQPRRHRQMVIHIQSLAKALDSEPSLDPELPRDPELSVHMSNRDDKHS